MANIGFVGLGNMGFPIMQNLLKAKHQLFVFDINPTAMQHAAETNATTVEDLSELAKNSEIIFTMLQTGEQVSQICCGENNLFADAKSGTLFIMLRIMIDKSEKMITASDTHTTAIKDFFINPK